MVGRGRENLTLSAAGGAAVWFGNCVGAVNRAGIAATCIKGRSLLIIAQRQRLACRPAAQGLLSLLPDELRVGDMGPLPAGTLLPPPLPPSASSRADSSSRPPFCEGWAREGWGAKVSREGALGAQVPTRFTGA